MIYLNAHYSVLGDLWVNKVSVIAFCNNWTLKTKNKT